MSGSAIGDKAVLIGKLSVRMTAQAGSGHPSSALSLAHIIAELMYRRLRFDPANPWDPRADRLVLSAGHAVPAVYAAYADLGGVIGHGPDDARPLTVGDVDDLRERNSFLDGHPNPAEGFPFFDAATGSLGMGLSVAAGLGLAARNDGLDRRIYCLIGDGEAREGQIWEAADFIIDNNLTNVITVINCNGHGQADAVSNQQSPERLAAKLTAFGFQTSVIDGHDPDAVEVAFAQAGQSDKPLAIVARTVKGWGVEQLLDGGNWHGKPLGPDDLAAAEASLDRHASGKPADIRPPAAPAGDAPSRPEPAAAAWPSFEATLKDAGLGGALDKGKLATRRAYGAALAAAGRVLPQVCALDADVSNSTFANIFASQHPERFFECKIAEQNMVSAAVGLAATGMIPFANSFAKFLSRAYDQVELASVSRANIKLVGSHSGISPCADGPSQMALVDVAYFRAFGTVRGDDRKNPLCWFFQPADARAAIELTRLMATTPGLCYMRTHRPDVPFMYDASTTFELGGLHTLRPGEDLALVSSGYTLQAALEAADKLASQGVRAGVIDIYSLPVQSDRLLEALARCGNTALVVEDNYGGGVGSAVAEIAAEAPGGPRVRCHHVQRLPKSTRTPQEEFEYCGVAAGQIADQALAMLRQPA